MFIVDGDVFADVIDLKAPQVVSEDAHIVSKLLFFAKKAAIGKRLQRSDSVKHRTNASQYDAAQRRPAEKSDYHVVIIS